jgi:hypothetical protein
MRVASVEDLASSKSPAIQLNLSLPTPRNAFERISFSRRFRARPEVEILPVSIR